MTTIYNLNEFLSLVDRNECPSGLTIDLTNKHLGAVGAEYIATALQSGNCPSGLIINLGSNNLGAAGAQHIATALQSGNCPSGLIINLGSNSLGAVGAKHIAAALKSGKCPSELTIDLRRNDLGAEGALHIAAALQSGNCPSGLTINLWDNDLGAKGAQHISDALQSGNCPSGLTINLNYNKLGADGTEHIATALKSGKCPSGLTINLNYSKLGAEGARHIATALQFGNCPSGLTIGLSDNNLGNEGAKHIATALQSGNCPSGLTIDLWSNKLGTNGTKHIADALQSGKCPSGLTIGLSDNNLGNEGAQHIADALKSGNCPSELTINLEYNNLGAAGTQHIADALKSGKCPSGLTINLEHNNLDTAGAQHIAAALKSGKCPSKLTINLGYNNLGFVGAAHIADALQSGKCPEGLTIDFGSNNLGAVGAAHIADALQSGNCPSGLTIVNFLRENPDIDSVISLAETIMHKNLPADLCLDFNAETFDCPKQSTILAKALFVSPYNIDKGLRLNGVPKVNLAFQKYLQQEAEYDDNSKADPQVCSPDAVQTRLTELINLYNSLDTLFPEEEIRPETSLAILQSFGTLLSRYEPAYQPSADAATVKAHYQYLDENLLPLIVDWHKKLLKQHNITDAHRKQFIEGCECLANLYNTNFDNEILLKEEDKACSQRTDRQPAQRALAIRAKLYQLTYRYRKESSAYLLTLLRLAESMTGKGLTLEGITGAQNKLENHAHALAAYKYMNEAWQAAAASNARLNSTLSEDKPASVSDDLNMAHVIPASATSAISAASATSAASPIEARSATSATSAQASRAPREQGVFNQPNSRSKEGTTTAIEATAARADELTGSITSQRASTSSAPYPLKDSHDLSAIFKTNR